MKLLPLEDGEVLLWENFFDQQESRNFFTKLLNEIDWQQRQIKIFGRLVEQPRLVAWYGEASYTYSGTTFDPLSWTETLLEIKARIEAVAGVNFNTVLCNLYRNGQDSMGLHSDNEPELKEVIASVSFGATRRFIFKHKKKKLSYEIELTSGSLLLMQGTTQHHWKHGLPKTQKPLSERINLTYRIVEKKFWQETATLHNLSD